MVVPFGCGGLVLSERMKYEKEALGLSTTAAHSRPCPHHTMPDPTALRESHVPFDNAELAHLKALARMLHAGAWLHGLVGCAALALVALLVAANAVYLERGIPQEALGPQLTRSAALAFGALLSGGLILVQARLLVRARRALTRVIETDEDDQAGLADVLARLASFFVCEALFAPMASLLTWQALMALLAPLTRN